MDVWSSDQKRWEVMADHQWNFDQCRMDRVVDGDTVDMEVDMGFMVNHSPRIRVARVDTSEIYGVSGDTAEYKIGKEQQQFVREWFEEREGEEEWPFSMTTEKVTGKFGRWVGVITGPGGDILNEDLVEEYPEAEID